ncbi:MAG: copper oxidase, partial [Clostridiales bacterium]|nr:copper oxidase [Clostridiales bacterium]
PADGGEDAIGDGSSVPVVTRLHGAAMAAAVNGHPDAWFTCNAETGPAYRTPLYTYPNRQDAATLWYHDNARGFAGANIYAGLAGFYLLRSGAEFGWQRDGVLPKGRYEIPLIIQDRSFNTDGSLSFSRDGVNPFKRDTGFLGNAITVNGKVWPNLSAERRLYRFRLLNGSDARVYNLRMSNDTPFTQIGTDAGFLPEPGTIDTLRLAPGECADVLVDFSALEPGTEVILLNVSGSPFSNKDASDPETTGQIMQFTVPTDAPEPIIPKKLPKDLR